jgi:hypothetical protein
MLKYIVQVNMAILLTVKPVNLGTAERHIHRKVIFCIYTLTRLPGEPGNPFSPFIPNSPGSPGSPVIPGSPFCP